MNFKYFFERIFCQTLTAPCALQHRIRHVYLKQFISILFFSLYYNWNSLRRALEAVVASTKTAAAAAAATRPNAQIECVWVFLCISTTRRRRQRRTRNIFCSNKHTYIYICNHCALYTTRARYISYSQYKSYFSSTLQLAAPRTHQTSAHI